MFERHEEPLLSRHRFFGRAVRFGAFAAFAVFIALLIGIAGYHWIVELSWIDSLLNASMILTGMGPVDPMHTAGAKLWASFYALFSGVVFLSSMGVFAAPFAHRLLHRFHLKEEG